MDNQADYFNRHLPNIVGGPRAPAGGTRARQQHPRPGAPPEQAPPSADCLCVTFHPDAVRNLADALEQRNLTSRGANVRAPSTCMQPVSASDVDEFSIAQAVATGFDVPSNIGARTVLATVTVPPGCHCVIKGFAATLHVQAQSSLDPYTQIGVTLFINSKRHAVYTRMAFAMGVGLAGLTATTILLKEGDTLTLEVERLNAGTGVVTAGGRLKGWQYQPVADMPGAAGTVAY